MSYVKQLAAMEQSSSSELSAIISSYPTVRSRRRLLTQFQTLALHKNGTWWLLGCIRSANP